MLLSGVWCLIALFVAVALEAARATNDDAGTDYSNRFGAHGLRFWQRALGVIAPGTAESHFMSGRVARSKKSSLRMAEHTALAVDLWREHFS
jgi:hypothetical protein